MENRVYKANLGQPSPLAWGILWLFLPMEVLLCMSLFVGCAPVEEMSADTSWRTVRKTAFFRYGPAQSGGAETLEESLPITVTAWDGGYAQVRLEDNQTGYVDRVDITPLPTPPAVPWEESRELVTEVSLPEDPEPDCTQVPDEMLFASMPLSFQQDTSNKKLRK